MRHQMKCLYKILAVGLIISAISVSCSDGRRRQRNNAATSAQNDSLPFKMVSIPAVITDIDGRIHYSMENFWDNLSPMCYGAQVEQQFANWASITSEVSLQEASGSLIAAYRKDPQRILALAEKYLYDPQSPYRNEDIYGHLAAFAGLDNVAALCALNEAGTKAADFEMEDSRGRMHTLYEVMADYTILFFSNPYCNACKEIIDSIKSDTELGEAIRAHRIAVVNVYIDEDLEQWRSYLGAYPKEWLTAYDPTFTLQNNEKYNIRAIPSLFLLDRDKTVILKDAPYDRITAKLIQLNGKL